MANLPSTFVKINDVELRQDTIVAESQFSKLGSNDNYLKDALDTEITARTSGDSANTTSYNNIKTEINAELVNIPCLVEEVTYGPFYPTGPWPHSIPINLSSNVLIYCHGYKFQSPSVDTGSRVRITLTNWDGGVAKVPYQASFLVSGLDRSEWDYMDFEVLEGLQIKVRFYKVKTISLP